MAKKQNRRSISIRPDVYLTARVQAQYIALALEYQAETGTPKEAMRDAIAKLVGRDRWPVRPTLQEMKEAVHSLDVALKEIKERGKLNDSEYGDYE